MATQPERLTTVEQRQTNVNGTGMRTRCTISGNVTLAGIATDFGSARINTPATIDMTDATSITNTGAQIDCNGVGRVTAAAVTGQRLVVHRAVDASGNLIRSWNGDGCTNVRFLGRRVIGDRLRAVA